MFIVALVTVAKIWKQPKCSSTGEWIKKMWCLHTMEYYSAIKMNEIMPFAAAWKEHRDYHTMRLHPRRFDGGCYNTSNAESDKIRV